MGENEPELKELEAAAGGLRAPSTPEPADRALYQACTDTTAGLQNGTVKMTMDEKNAYIQEFHAFLSEMNRKYDGK